MTTEQFIEKAKLIHNNKYDYSLSVYINPKTKVKIICPKHGIFEQMPYSHLSGRGCSFCCGGRKYTNEEYINKVKNIFPEYDFSITKYTASNKSIEAICPKHGVFRRQASQLLLGKGCGKCGKESSVLKHRNSIDNLNKRFIKNHEEEFYDPVFVDGNTLSDKILVFCNICGKQFSLLTNNFLSGYGCKNCMRYIFSSRKTLTNDDFIKKSIEVHGNLYDYSEVEYKGINEKVKIKCKECNNYFYQTPDAHWKGGGCPYCRGSFGEKKISSILKSKEINFIPQKTFLDLRDKNELSYDFYLPDYNLLIEYNGEQHYNKNSFGRTYKDFLLQKHHDWLKRKYALKNNYDLLVISYKDDVDKIIKNIDQ